MEVFVNSNPNAESIEITKYRTDLMLEVEHDTDIGMLYTRWRQYGSPPHAANFQVQGANVGRFRVSSENPSEFTYAEADDDAEVLAVEKFDNPLIRNQMLDDLMLVKETGEPLYQQVIHRADEREMCFRRVLLPVIDDEGDVELIYTSTRQFGLAEPTLLRKEMDW